MPNLANEAGTSADVRAEALEALIEAMAHALRTPLGTVANTASLLRVSGTDEATIVKVAEILDRTARAATGMVADMEEIARLERGVALSIGPMDAESMSRRVVVEARPLAAQRGLDVRLATVTSQAALSADEPRLRQAFSRLVGHCVELAKPGSTIAVFVDVTDATTCLSVEDHGPPIPAADLPWLFAIDGRRAPSRRRGGLGLGLPIARAIAEAHGGTVRCEPGESCTATFRLTVPTRPSR